MGEGTVGVYWGRFNPVHKGHMAQLMACAKRVDRLIVAVGGAEHKNEKRNPFSGSERVKMIKAYMKEKGLDTNKIRVVAVKDGRSFDESVDNLFKACGKIDVVFMTRSYPRAKVLERKAKVELHPLKGRAWGMSATRIRNAIAHGRSWESFTGKSVVALIKRLNGIERIRKAYARS
jgi:nicotinamide-nucleotide adenylyltransferase